MPKTRREEGGLGDWSSTGTFLRKPTTGWLHEDRELCNQSSINYRIWYLGCIEVCQSMRTLQYNMRTQVTKEAIIKMADGAGKLQQHKKKKVPKQLTRLLGAVDTRWAGEVNLAVSAENLRISNASSNREIMNHSLPSISFASGGDGATIDFIGYVAKDPVHERACHVFECVECSQYVLTTIGQAFELRYKMYLNSPQPEPLQIRNSISTGDSWAADSTYEQRGPQAGEASLPDVPGEPPTAYSPTPVAGIYSDLPEFPSDSVPSPSPSPSSSAPSLPPLTAVSGGRSRVYSQLPGFPTLHENKVSPFNGSHQPRLDNPYDTIHSTREKPQFTDSVYSEPGEITSSTEESYSSHIKAVRQSSATPMNSELIDLTPPLQHPNHIYTNSSIHNGAMAASPPKSSPAPLPKPRPLPRPWTEKRRVPPSPPAEADYDDPSEPFPPPVVRGHDQPDYDDPDLPHMKPTREGLYDDIQDVIGAKKHLKGPKSPPLVPCHRGLGSEVKERRVIAAPDYDDPNTLISANGVSGDLFPNNQYETLTEPRKSRSRTPKFDDTIYAIRRDVGVEEGEEEEMEGGAMGNTTGYPPQAVPDPLAPLPSQTYFHGVISRVEAEALLEAEGEFLVRESSKIPGQFVLTGLSQDGHQHLLLMDRSGRVKSRDHHFDSIPHLVEYFTTRDTPLIIGKSRVFLRRAVVNAFPGNRAPK